MGDAAIDSSVNPGNPPHRHQTRPKADSTGTYHRMVLLAKGSPGCAQRAHFEAKSNRNAKLTLASIHPDQAGIDRKGFTADQAFLDAALQDYLKHAQ